MHTNDNLPVANGQSPFDAGRTPCPQGGEDRWSARWLMTQMGYPTWQHFEPVIERAKASAHNQGFNVRTLFTVIRENSGGRPRVDYQLTRFAAYLVAMNGDPRKDGVAAAQAYFVIKTREAELARPAFDPSMLSRADILRLALNAEEELQAEKAKTAELEPRAEAYDSFLDATGKYGMGAVAKMLGSSQNKLFRDLRNAGVLISKGSMRNTPYQPYMKYFEVRAHDYERSNGELGCSYTTYVQPAGIDFIRRRLNLPTIDPLPVAEVSA